MNILVTGSSGLIGSECVRHFDRQGAQVVGLDNNLRRYFFGPGGDTTWVRDNLLATTRQFQSISLDIRDRTALEQLFREHRFEAVIHCAAQPSHDWAKKEPFTDFDVNAVGTLNLLEMTRLHAPEAAFLFMSTNKVYGDAPNEVPLVETPTRWDYRDAEFAHGIAESFRVDRCTHSIFGASKLAADVMVQEYGRYFGMKTVCFRGGCLTGPMHSGVELHGFLSYLAKAAVYGIPYSVFGYKGKQVRDNIHSADVVAAFEAFIAKPRSGAVYNLGGGKTNSVSMLEAITKLEQDHGHRLEWKYVDDNRIGDHICYYSDLRRFQADYPDWRLTKSLDETLAEIVHAMRKAKAAGKA